MIVNTWELETRGWWWWLCQLAGELWQASLASITLHLVYTMPLWEVRWVQGDPSIPPVL